MKSLLALIALPCVAQAHEGHGMAGATHWHATDAWGLALLGAAVALALWLRRGK